MLTGLNNARVVNLDGHKFKVHALPKGYEPLGYACPRCTSLHKAAVVGDMLQWGIGRDCHILLMNCTVCSHDYAVRYFIWFDEDEPDFLYSGNEATR